MFKPTQYDHDKSLRACYRIEKLFPDDSKATSYKTGSPAWAINILNQVAGAYTCNEKACVSYTDYASSLSLAK